MQNQHLPFLPLLPQMTAEFLYICEFTEHELNDMNIANANVFVPNKLLQLPSFCKMGRGREWTPHTISFQVQEAEKGEFSKAFCQE